MKNKVIIKYLIRKMMERFEESTAYYSGYGLPKEYREGDINDPKFFEKIEGFYNSDISEKSDLMCDMNSLLMEIDDLLDEDETALKE